MHNKYGMMCIKGSIRLMVHELAIFTRNMLHCVKVLLQYQHIFRMWEEFEALVPNPSCNCDKSNEFVVPLQKLKLFQFLMGLNDSYYRARRQILLMIPIPLVNQAYVMIISDEGHKL